MKKPFVTILGIAQDGGVPHCGCNKSCCRDAWNNINRRKHAASLGIIDSVTDKRWIIDATPDFKFQLALLEKNFPRQKDRPILDGILLTHGHVGHYTGLICLEKAMLDTKDILVFAMPKMKKLLIQNLPWKKLVDAGNIKIVSLSNKSEVKLNSRLSVIPFLVPHRDEYSETVGFIIKGPNKSILFIPDIDGWELFKNIKSLIKSVDLAFLDGTFFNKDELAERNIEEVSHPFIQESVNRFCNLALSERRKIFFIHFNHTNPVLSLLSDERKFVVDNGFNVAWEKQIVKI